MFGRFASVPSAKHPTDRDGTIDMIFPTCSYVSSDGVGEDCYINVAFNQQLNLCSSTTDSGINRGVRTCRSPQGLCTADPNFRFDFYDSSKPGVCTCLCVVDIDVKLTYFLVIHAIPTQVFVFRTEIPSGLRYFVPTTCSSASEVGRCES